MRTDKKSTPNTYTAQSALQTSPSKHEGKILSESVTDLEKTKQTSSGNVTQNLNQKISPPVTKPAV